MKIKLSKSQWEQIGKKAQWKAPWVDGTDQNTSDEDHRSKLRKTISIQRIEIILKLLDLKTILEIEEHIKQIAKGVVNQKPSI